MLEGYTYPLRDLALLRPWKDPNPPPSSPRQGTLNPDHLITKITHTHTHTLLHIQAAQISVHTYHSDFYSLFVLEPTGNFPYIFMSSAMHLKMFVIFYKTFIGVLPREGF